MGISEQLYKYLSSEHYFSNIGTLKAKSDINVQSEINAEDILEELKNATVDEILDVCLTGSNKPITAKNIPQISRLESGTIELISTLNDRGNYGMSYIDIGKVFLGEGKSDDAYIKYGENHAKLAKELDLVYTMKYKQLYVYTSELGNKLLTYSAEEQAETLAKLMTLIPIIRYTIKIAGTKEIDVKEVMMEVVSEATAIRRKHSVKKLLHYIEKYSTLHPEVWEHLL